MKYLILIYVFGQMISCSQKNTVEEFYPNGKLKTQILLSLNGDTLEVLSYSENGKLLKETIFQGDSLRIFKTYYDTSAYYKSSIEIYNYKKLWGVQRYFSKENFDSIFQIGLYYKNYSCATHSELDSLNNKLIFQYRSINDSQAVAETVWCYDSLRNFNKNKSFCYFVHGKDTIQQGQAYNYQVEIVFDKYVHDSALTLLTIGNIDVNGIVTDTLIYKEGYEKYFNLQLSKPQIGYNLITGNLKVIGVENNKVMYVKPVTIYHDFFVTQKETK